MTEPTTQEPENPVFDWDDPWLFLLLVLIFSATSEQLQAISENLRKTLEEHDKEATL